VASNYEVNIKLNTRTVNKQLNNLEKRISKLNKLAQGGRANRTVLRNEQEKIKKTGQRLGVENKILKRKQEQLKVDQQQLKVLQQSANVRTKQASGGATTGRGESRGGGKGGVLSGALISGAFPLLFGQGVVGGAFGFAGGAIGGAVGGQTGGFAGGLVATAALTQITTAVEKVKELGKALSVQNLNLDPIIKAIGGVGTSTEKYLKLIEQVEGKQAAYNAAVDKMRSIVGDKGVKDIQEFTKRMQDLTNALSTFFTRLGAGFAGIFNKLANSPLGKAASATNLKLDRLARAENNTDPLMVALRGKRDALIGSKTGAQATKVRNSPEFQDLNNRVAALQHFFDLQQKITEEENIQKLTTDSILKNVKEENLFLQQSMLMGSEQAQIEAKIRDLKEQRKSIGETLSAADEKALRDQLKLNNALNRANELQKEMTNLVANNMGNAMKDLITGAKSFNDVMRNALNNMANAFLNLGIFGNVGGSFERGQGLLGKIFRAEGGPVKGGKSYVVGERGPEMFTPGVSGMVTPNHALGGSTTVVVNVDASGSSVEGDETQGRELGRAISVAVQSEILQQKRPGGLLA